MQLKLTFVYDEEIVDVIDRACSMQTNAKAIFFFWVKIAIQDRCEMFLRIYPLAKAPRTSLVAGAMMLRPERMATVKHANCDFHAPPKKSLA